MARIVALDQLQQFAAVQLMSDPGYLPGPKIIPNAAMVRLDWQLTNGKVGHNVMYGSYTGSPALGVASAQAIFAAITTGGVWTTLAAFLAPTASLRSVTVLDVRSTTATEFRSTGTSAPGTSVGTALPDEVSLSLRFNTAMRGPSGRGRIYIPGWATNALAAGGVAAAAAVTALSSWFNNVVFPAIGTNVGALVLGLPQRAAYTSPITGRVFPARNATTVVVNGIVVPDNHWDTQRRRGLK